MHARILFLITIVLAPAAAAQSLTGLWDASLRYGDITIPFRMEIATKGSAATGSFFNGDQKVTSTHGTFSHLTLVLEFNYYGSKLTADWKNGELSGRYERGGKTFPMTAKPFQPVPAEASGVPSIAGAWVIETGRKGDSAWHLVVRQSGAEVSGAILRVDGDTGALSGKWTGGKFVLGHFDGTRPALYEITPRPDGSLTVVQNGSDHFAAVRPSDARTKGLPEPTDPTKYTSVKDPSEKFHFSFPDLNGRIVSDTDPRFQGKVVIVSVGGSWCPNCHDEAPLLVDLYRRFHSHGLEIVELSFEEADQLKNPERVRAFIKKYDIPYPVLLPGEPSELEAKIPQAANLAAFPTTFFLGRDGRVRSVHAGFAAAVTGDFHTRLIAETTELVERLLAEPAPKLSASSNR
jgi:peroxiredoxin